MAASASRSSSSQAALPPWVKELLTSVPATSTCIVAVSRGDFVVKVYPATPHHAPLQQDQQRKAHQPAHQPRRAAREGGQQTRAQNARQLRSALRAKEHAAKRRSSRLRLQGLLHRHLWRQHGWQRVQDVWVEWSRGTAPPLPVPAPPPSRPLPIVDLTAFPALPPAPAKAPANLRKREVADNPPLAPPKTATALVSVTQPVSAWATVKKPRTLRGYYHEAAAAPPAAAPPITTVCGIVT